MSDAEDEIPPPLQAPGETIRMGGVQLDKDALAAGIEKGNISIATTMGGADTIRLTEVCGCSCSNIAIAECCCQEFLLPRVTGLCWYKLLLDCHRIIMAQSPHHHHGTPVAGE